MSLSEEYFYSCHCFPLSWRRLWMNELSGSQLWRRAHISASVQTSFPWAKDWKCMLASLFLSLRYKSQKCMRPNVKSFIYTMLSRSLPVAPCLCSELKECSRWNECYQKHVWCNIDYHFFCFVFWNKSKQWQSSAGPDQHSAGFKTRNVKSWIIQ